MDRRRVIVAVAGTLAVAAFFVVAGYATWVVLHFGWADHDERRAGPDDLSLTYSPIGGAGFLDQFLTVTSRAEDPLVLDGVLEALDADGQPLPAVQVRSAYGIERGEVVISPGVAAVDVLTLTGPDRERVAEVRLADGAQVRIATLCGTAEYVPVDGVTGTGVPVNGYDFAALRLTNDHPEPARVQPVLLVLDVPPEGRSQQPTEVVPLGGVVDVPPGEAVVVALDPQLRDQVRAFGRSAPLSPQTYAVPAPATGC